MEALKVVPVDLKARVLTTRTDLDEATCSIDVLEAAARYFGLGLPAARTITRDVALVTQTWRDVAPEVGVKGAEIKRMESAFEHEEKERALKL